MAFGVLLELGVGASELDVVDPADPVRILVAHPPSIDLLLSTKARPGCCRRP